MSACRGRGDDLLGRCAIDTAGAVIGLAGGRTQRRRCRNDAHGTTWVPQRRGWHGVWAAAVEGLDEGRTAGGRRQRGEGKRAGLVVLQGSAEAGEG